MSKIVCAIRGGPGSRSTIHKAIELAKARGGALYFLYVFNLGFLSHTSHSRTDAIAGEMQKMGEFILLMAQTLAAEQKVAAEGVMRQGQVEEEIVALAEEVGADTVVLGRPLEQKERNVFTFDRFPEFVQGVREQTGADVVLVNGA